VHQQHVNGTDVLRRQPLREQRRIFVVVVLRVDGPQRDRVARRQDANERRSIELAVRWADPWAPRHLTAERLLRAFELIHERLAGELVEPGVIVAVARELVAAPHVLAHEVRVRVRVRAAAEERGGDAEIIEHVEVALGVIVGTVVEGERHAARRGRPSPQAVRDPVEDRVLHQGANRGHYEDVVPEA
jgi:hypothetical protein